MHAKQNMEGKWGGATCCRAAGSSSFHMAGAPWLMSYNSDVNDSREVECNRKRSSSYLLVLQANAEWGQDIVAESVTA